MKYPLCFSMNFTILELNGNICYLHEKEVNPNDKCSGKRYAGIGLTCFLFPPWHPIQRAARKHDDAYSIHPCASTKGIDSDFLTDFAMTVNKFYSKEEAKPYLDEASLCFKIVRAYGDMRFSLCQIRKKDTLI